MSQQKLIHKHHCLRAFPNLEPSTTANCRTCPKTSQGTASHGRSDHDPYKVPWVSSYMLMVSGTVDDIDNLFQIGTENLRTSLAYTPPQTNTEP